MKKRFTFLIAAIVLLTMINLPGKVWATDETIEITYSNVTRTSYSSSEETFDIGSITFGYINAMRNNSNNTPTGWASNQVIQTKNTGYIYNKTAISGLKNIRVYIVANTNSFTITSGEELRPTTNSVTRPSTPTGNESITYTSYVKPNTYPGQTTTANYYDFSVSDDYFQIAPGGSLYIWKIVLTYEEGPSTYTVSFDCDDATANCPDAITDLEEGDDFTIPSTAPTKDCYTFGGWFDDELNEYELGQTYQCPASDLTLTADWTLNNYSITYKPNGATGSDVVVSNQNCGSSYTIAGKPNAWEVPAATPNFVKWSTAANGQGTEYNVGQEITISGDLELYAQWSATATYTVTYVPGTGATGSNVVDNNVSGSYTVRANDGENGNPTFSKEGYTFKCWNNGSNDVTAGSNITVSSNVTLTAQWLENLSAPTFTVTGVSNGTANTYYVTANIEIEQEDGAYIYYTTDGSDPTNESTEYTAAFTVTNSCTIKAIAIFEGYADSEIVSQEIIIVQPNVATFTNGVYSESFSSSLGLWYANSVSGNYKWAQGTPVNNYTGANINGYGENANNEDWLISPKMTVLNGKLDVSFKTAARYSGAAMVVKYSTDYNGYGNPNNFTWTDMSPSLSTNTNNTFSGWTDGKATISGLSDNANVYVAFKYTSSYHSAKQYVIKDFTANQYYSVLYNPGEGSGTMTDPNLYAVGSEVTALECTFTAPSNKVFSNWKVEVDDEDPEYVNGDETFTMGAVVTLTAQWVEPAQIITVTYSENGATHSETVTEGNEVTLVEPTNAAPANMTFAGWAENPITKFSESAPAYVTEYEAVASKTFYAVYEYNCPTGGITKGWKRVDNASTLAKDDLLIIANDVRGKVALDITNKYLLACGVATFDGGIITENNDDVVVFTLGGSNGAWTLSNNDKTLTTAAAKELKWDGNASGVASTWAISILEGNATIASTNEDYGTIQYNYNQGSDRFLNYTSTQEAIQLYRYEDIAATKSYYVTSVTELAEATTIAVSTTTTLDHNVTINTNGYTINGTLDANGYLIANKTASNIVVNDGGQLKVSNAVKATVKKNITQEWVPASGIGWYTISTPTGLTGFGDVANLKPMDGENRLYDIYRYKESTMTWENSIEAGFDNDRFEECRGYLYRKGNTNALEFAGPVNIAASYVQDLSVTGETAIAGFALLGNPYSHNINLKHVTVNAGDNLDACYILSGEGAWGASIGNTADIAPCTGFLVQATEECKATIHKSQARDSKANADYIQFIVANNQYEDVTFALFDEGHGLNKINHRNSNIQQIYIPKDGESFAVATMADNTQSFNLNFKAMTMGQYTLSFKTKGEFNYLHVIDRMTGEDIDMILEGEYSFIGSPQDNEARFIVRLGYLPNYDNNGEDIFAYQNGSDVIVSGEGELQIFDVIGRMVSTQNINGTETISVNAQGVYVLRLVGTEIKTQKIVVK